MLLLGLTFTVLMVLALRVLAVWTVLALLLRMRQVLLLCRRAQECCSPGTMLTIKPRRC